DPRQLIVQLFEIRFFIEDRNDDRGVERGRQTAIFYLVGVAPTDPGHFVQSARPEGRPAHAPARRRHSTRAIPPTSTTAATVIETAGRFSRMCTVACSP